MQAIAGENNLSETAFYVPAGKDRFGLRWFTPTIEVDLCGHATLGTAHVVFEIRREVTGDTVTFESRSGELRVKREGDLLTLDFPSRPASEGAIDTKLVDALGAAPSKILGAQDYLCIYETEEQVRALKEIWTKDEAEFHGRHVNFDKIWSWPKPAQKPHPPVLLGGESAHTLQRVVDLCDGWFPRGRAAEIILPALKDLGERAAKAGRDMKTISTSIFGAKPEAGTLETYAQAGITRAILRLPPEGRDTVLPLLDQWAKLIKR
jgi:hypothetical protein